MGMHVEGGLNILVTEPFADIKFNRQRLLIPIGHIIGIERVEY